MPAGRATGGRLGLVSVWVRPGCRVAEHLIAAVRDRGVDQGGGELLLRVANGNTAAMRVYQRAGFVPTGRRRPLPSAPAVGEEQWVLVLEACDRPPAGG